MTDTRTRQPPPKICDHFDWDAWMKPGKHKPKCKAGVEYRSVSHGLDANFGIGTVPCYSMCDAATCDERKLKEPVTIADDPQRRLF